MPPKKKTTKQEEPSFSKKELTSKTKKRKPVKRTGNTNASVRKSPAKKRPAKKTAPKQNSKEVQKFLEDIYESKKGKSNFNDLKMKKRHPFLKFIFSLLFLGAIFTAIAWVGFLTFYQGGGFKEENLKLEITGAKEINLGEELTYIISYENKQGVGLENAVLTAKYPAGFEYLSASIAPANGNNEWDLGELDGNEEGEIQIKGKMYGNLKEEQSWRVFLNYSPENFESELQTVATLRTQIKNSPFKLLVEGPDVGIVGNDVQYKFKLEKIEEPPAGLYELTVDYPENFYLTEAEPELNDNNSWEIDFRNTTSTPEFLEFSAVGSFSDSEEKVLEIEANLNLIASNEKIFSIAKQTVKTEITDNDLGFSLAINGSLKKISIQPDELLNISLKMENTSGETFKDTEVKLLLDAPSVSKENMLDWAQINDPSDGDIQGIQLDENTRRGQIVWNSRHLPALAKVEPGDKIMIDINLPIKNYDEISLGELEKYTINASGEISYDINDKEKIISSNPISIVVNSDLDFERRDQVAGNTHQISWILTNHFHPLKNIKVSADIYGNIEFTAPDPEEMPGGALNYNQESQRLVWEIEEMPLQVDVLALPFTINLKTTDPTQEVLMAKVKIEAEDTATGEIITFLGEEILL